MYDDIEVTSCREFCNCGGILVRQSTFSNHWRDNEENSFYLIQIFKILTCITCHSATVLLYTSIGNEDADGYWAESKPEEPQSRSYGRKVLYAPATKLHHSIPRSISEVFSQAEAVLVRSARASFILCRAVLEEICNDFAIPTKGTNNKGEVYFIGLKKRLEQLFKQEQLSEDLRPIVDGIKDLGNEGAHSNHLAFTEQVESEDAETLLELVNFVLEKLYVDKYRQQESAQKLETLKRRILPLEQ